MFPFQSYYGYESWPNQNCFFQEPPPQSSSVNLMMMDGGDSILSSASKAEIRKSTEACKSHKEAERRRRQRINAHLSTLRTLLPNTTKTDKASLLAEVVHHVKELTKQVADVARQDSDGSETDKWLFPGESDEMTVGYCDDGVGEAKVIKVSLCCEDRPGLNRDLNRAIQSVRARVVRAEMMTVGGRTKTVLVMQWAAAAGGGGGDEEIIEVLRRALKDVVENRASGSGLGRVAVGSKRARLYGSVNESDEFLGSV